MERNNFAQGINDYGKTEPVGGFNSFGGETGGVPEWGGETAGTGFIPTEDAPNGSGFTLPTDGGFAPDQIGVTEPVTPNNTYGFMPVVGWLVCVEGVDRGRDYRIHAGYNSIGRDPGNDICISGDMKITREKHALIGFDSQDCLFFFAPGNSINMVRINNKVLMMPSELHAGDVLTIGSSKLIFVPLCNENFNWEKSDSDK